MDGEKMDLESGPATRAPSAAEAAGRGPLLAGLFLAAVLGRLPAFGAWWALDDWGQLGRAAGLLERSAAFPPRLLSQHLWWQATWPVFGLDPEPQSLIRILLHGAATVLVARLGRRAGLSRAGWFAAAAVFAATPLAFTPTYWASGIQELLAVVFALLAVDRWFAGGRANLAWALGATLVSLLAKESGLGLPLFFLAALWFGGGVSFADRPFAWAMVLFMLLAAVMEGVLVMGGFATGPGEPYALGGSGVAVSNLGTFGWWLLSPGPLLAYRVSWAMGAAGASLFLLWTLWSVMAARHRNLLPAATLLAALLVLGPALPLRTQIHPYLAYLAVAPLALALTSLLPRRWPLKLPLAAAICLLAAVWGFAGMRARLSARNEVGFPADPVVRATSLSWDAARTVRSLLQGARKAGSDSTLQLTLLQVPIAETGVENSLRLGPRWVQESELYLACGGTTGMTLAAGGRARADWRNALTDAPAAALVLAEAGEGFKVWGRTPNALLYAALTDVGLGHYERARLHLRRAADLHGERIEFLFDEGQMIVPLAMATKNVRPFIDWTVSLLDQGSSRFEVGGLQTMFLDLMSISTGRPVDELIDGSTIILPGSSGLPGRSGTPKEK